MQIVQTVWYWLLPHWLDVVIAIALAVIVDLLRIGSLLRSVARHIKNKLAEGSAILLRKRIAKLERYRNTLKSYADKSIYLGTLNSIVKVLVLMSFAGILFLMKYAGFLRDGDIGAICALSAAAGAGMSALRWARLDIDTEHALSVIVAQLDKDISILRMKLNRTQ